MNNASLNTAPLRALRKASSKTNLIEQAGHMFAGATTTSSRNNSRTRRRRSSSRTKPKTQGGGDDRRGLMSKSRSAYGRLVDPHGTPTGSTSSILLDILMLLQRNTEIGTYWQYQQHTIKHFDDTTKK